MASTSARGPALQPARRIRRSRRRTRRAAGAWVEGGQRGRGRGLRRWRRGRRGDGPAGLGGDRGRASRGVARPAQDPGADPAHLPVLDVDGVGAGVTFFYNDAYRRDTLGVKHPWALGRPAREVWAEVSDDIGLVPSRRTARSSPAALRARRTRAIPPTDRRTEPAQRSVPAWPPMDTSLKAVGTAPWVSDRPGTECGCHGARGPTNRPPPPTGASAVAVGSPLPHWKRRGDQSGPAPHRPASVIP
jgi:hypothetical protein